MNKTSNKKILLGIAMSTLLMVIFATLFVAAPVAANDFKYDSTGITVFEMPELDIQKTYTYYTVFDLFVPERIGQEAVLYWGEKEEIAGEEYYVFDLSKLDGREVQYLGLDTENEDITLKGIVDTYKTTTFMDLTFNPESLYIDYPLYVGKTWEREEVSFSGMALTEYGYVPVAGTTWGSASVTDQEDIVVPAGVAHCLIIEMTMNSCMTIDGEEMRMSTSQKIWLMENGFFAKRQLYHFETFKEELELTKPILATVDIKPTTLNLKSNGLFIAFIELSEGYDVANIDISTVECEGALAIEGYTADGSLIVKFDIQDIVDVQTGNTVLFTVTGEFYDGSLFEGSDMIRVIDE